MEYYVIKTYEHLWDEIKNHLEKKLVQNYTWFSYGAYLYTKNAIISACL